MELTKSHSSGALWYTKKFIVLYYHIFFMYKIASVAAGKKICAIFDDQINSFPDELQIGEEIFLHVGGSSRFEKRKDPY